MMDSSDDREAVHVPKRRKRIITHARKEQNRVAQKLYRQRQRDRVRNRESKRNDLPRKQHQLLPRQPKGLEVDERITTNPVIAETREAPMQSDSDAPFDENALHPNVSQSSEQGCVMLGFIPGAEVNIDEILSLPMDPTSLFPALESSMLTNAHGHDRTTFQTMDEAASVRLSASNSLGAPPTIRVPFMFNSSIWPPLMNSTPLSLPSTPHELLEETPLNASIYSPHLTQNPTHYQQNYTTNISDALDYPRNFLVDIPASHFPGLSDLLASVSKFLSSRGSYCLLTPQPSPSPPLPSPLLTTLPCPLTTTLLAYFHNATCINLSIPHLLSLPPTSPFHFHQTLPSTNPQTLLSAARKPWIPTHLQPTLPQILIPHHPYLDLVPLPGLRTRAIVLRELFDPMELKMDVFAGGLVCCPGGRGQPWDGGSWEMALWFRRKWRLLLG
ncbi:hypothetical protein EG329_005928 [Mollisiaceae sp. DMI_Dod_QoI]|nr:hypothetical protein EG329_005928 [Helotiales sp. DMI_Dod_QoI]